MTAIAKHQKSRIETALSCEKIRFQEDISERLKQIYRTALMTAGIKSYEVDDVRMQIGILEKILRDNYAGITIEELAYASEQGVIGKYGEWHGVNPATFCKWIDAYIESQERKRAIRENKKPRELPNHKTLNRIEKQQFWNEVEKGYLKSGKIVGELVLYPIGVELGYIDIKDEIVVEEAIFSTIKFFENKLTNLKLGGYMARIIRRDLVNGLVCDIEKKRSPSLWINQCKREAVKIAMATRNV